MMERIYKIAFVSFTYVQNVAIIYLSKEVHLSNARQTLSRYMSAIQPWTSHEQAPEKCGNWPMSANYLFCSFGNKNKNLADTYVV